MPHFHDLMQIKLQAKLDRGHKAKFLDINHYSHIVTESKKILIKQDSNKLLRISTLTNINNKLTLNY